MSSQWLMYTYFVQNNFLIGRKLEDQEKFANILNCRLVAKSEQYMEESIPLSTKVTKCVA